MVVMHFSDRLLLAKACVRVVSASAISSSSSVSISKVDADDKDNNSVVEFENEGVDELR